MSLVREMTLKQLEIFDVERPTNAVAPERMASIEPPTTPREVYSSMNDIPEVPNKKFVGD